MRAAHTPLLIVLAARPPHASSVSAAAGPAGLQLNVVATENLRLSYADHGSGADMDLFTHTPSCDPTTVAPRCAEPWFSLGDVGGASETVPATAVVARAGSADPTALAAPIAMELNWNTSIKRASKGTSGGVYTPTCPSGYVAMGSVAIEHDILHSTITPALFPTLRCVKDKYTKGGGPLLLLWDSKPTAFDTPCSVWQQPAQTIQQRPDVSVPLPMVGGQQSFSAPPTSVALQFDTTAGIDVIVPPPPTCPNASKPEKKDLQGDYLATATAATGGTMASCQEACCANPACITWSWVNSVPKGGSQQDWPQCTASQSCCFLRNGPGWGDILQDGCGPGCEMWSGRSGRPSAGHPPPPPPPDGPTAPLRQRFRPPRYTTVQKTAIERIAANAVRDSAAAKAWALSYMNSSAVRGRLDASLQHYSDDQLLEMLGWEMDHLPIYHDIPINELIESEGGGGSTGQLYDDTGLNISLDNGYLQSPCQRTVLGGPQNLIDALQYSQIYTDSFGWKEGADSGGGDDQCNGHGTPSGVPSTIITSGMSCSYNEAWSRNGDQNGRPQWESPNSLDHIRFDGHHWIIRTGVPSTIYQVDSDAQLPPKTGWLGTGEKGGGGFPCTGSFTLDYDTGDTSCVCTGGWGGDRCDEPPCSGDETPSTITVSGTTDGGCRQPYCTNPHWADGDWIRDGSSNGRPMWTQFNDGRNKLRWEGGTWLICGGAGCPNDACPKSRCFAQTQSSAQLPPKHWGDATLTHTCGQPPQCDLIATLRRANDCLNFNSNNLMKEGNGGGFGSSSDVAFVLNRKTMADSRNPRIFLEPGDGGRFAMSGDWPLGITGAWFHLLKRHEQIWVDWANCHSSNGDCFRTQNGYSIADMFNHWWVPSKYPLSQLRQRGGVFTVGMDYFETMSTPPWLPEDLLCILAEYDAEFHCPPNHQCSESPDSGGGFMYGLRGQPQGRELRDWARKHRRPLVWSKHATDDMILDPVVGGFSGSTITDADRQLFERHWSAPPWEG